MQSQNPKIIQRLQTWRARLSPLIGFVIIGIFIYWILKYWSLITGVFQNTGFWRLGALIIIILISLVLSVFTFTILVKDKGYSSFGFWDGYNSLNLSQLAAMVPGKIWGFAGLAALLWSKGISKMDSALIILLNTLINLTACAVIGIASIATVYGWSYAWICFLPFMLLSFGRNWLDRLRQKFFPSTSHLPSTRALVTTFLLAVIVWALVSSSFAVLLYTVEGAQAVPFWQVTGAYAAGYLGGFLALFAPSGIGVSEGVTAVLLGPYIGIDNVLAVAISFRVIHTFIIWSNILVTVILTSKKD